MREFYGLAKNLISPKSFCRAPARVPGLASAAQEVRPWRPPHHRPERLVSRLRSYGASSQRSDWELYHDGGQQTKSSFRAGPLPAKPPASGPPNTGDGAGFRQTLRLDQHDWT